MRFLLRTSPYQPAPADASLVDWFLGRSGGTVQYGGTLLDAVRPPPGAMDLLRVAVAAYVADRVTPREASWRREIDLVVPSSDPDRLRDAASVLCEALGFLTSDRWTLTPADVELGVLAPRPPMVAVDAVCLFSGGLDSLAGAIDLLGRGQRLCLVSHYEGGVAPTRQRELGDAVQAHFGAGHVRRRYLFLRPAAPAAAQARPLPTDREDTTRGRSLLFIAAGLAVASAHGPEVALHFPENGFIGLNVPLTRSRPASLSTRTTHPHFVRVLSRTAAVLGVTNPLVNQFALMTKGEALAASPAPDLLAELAPRSVSCSHPEAARFDELPPMNCGRCLPCMIRRAALHHIGQDTSDGYVRDVLRESEVLELDDAGADARAVALSLARPVAEGDVIRNGPLTRDEMTDYLSLYERGRAELRAWLSSGHPRLLRAARLEPAVGSGA